MRFGSAGVTAAALSTIVAALAVPATAQAGPTADVVAGRERVKVTVHGVPVHPESCRVDPDADGHTRSLPVEPSGSMVAHGVAPGPRRVLVWCPDGGIVHEQIVHVLPADPLADLADHMFRTAGSSDRVTDPTLR